MGFHCFNVPCQRRWRAGRVRRAGIRRRARARRGALVRHSRRNGPTDMQARAGPRRCGSPVRHSGTVSRCTTKVSSSGPKSDTGRTSQACRDLQAGPNRRGALVCHSRICRKGHAVGSVLVTGRSCVTPGQKATGVAPSSSRPETVAACTCQAFGAQYALAVVLLYIAKTNFFRRVSTAFIERNIKSS